MRRAIANGTLAGDGRTRRWTPDAPRCVERPLRAAPLLGGARLTACVTELAEMGITKTARARRKFGAFDATRAEPGSLVDLTEKACNVMSVTATRG